MILACAPLLEVLGSALLWRPASTYRNDLFGMVTNASIASSLILDLEFTTQALQGRQALRRQRSVRRWRRCWRSRWWPTFQEACANTSTTCCCWDALSAHIRNANTLVFGTRSWRRWLRRWWNWSRSWRWRWRWSSGGDSYVSTVRPNLRGLFALPSEGKQIVARCKISWDIDIIDDAESKLLLPIFCLLFRAVCPIEPRHAASEAEAIKSWRLRPLRISRDAVHHGWVELRRRTSTAHL